MSSVIVLLHNTNQRRVVKSLEMMDVGIFKLANGYNKI